MRRAGFSYIEVLASLFLLLFALLFVGRVSMTSLQVIGRGKVNHRATLLLLNKIEQLRSVPIQDLTAGEYEVPEGAFLVQWRINDHTPYFGTKQIHCRVVYKPVSSTIVESLFYRAE